MNDYYSQPILIPGTLVGYGQAEVIEVGCGEIWSGKIWGDGNWRD
jgi:hypothetical protein